MGLTGSDFRRDLGDNEFQAAVNANAPTALNPFATVADLIPDTDTNVFNTNGVTGAGRTLGVTDTFVIEVDSPKKFGVGPTAFTPAASIHFKATTTAGMYIEGLNSNDGNRALTIYNSGRTLRIAAFENNSDIILCEDTTTSRSRLTVGTLTPVSNAKITVRGANGAAGNVAAYIGGSTGTGGLQVQNDDRVSIGAVGAVTEKFSVRGIGTSNTTYTAQFENQSGTPLNRWRDDGLVELAMTGGQTFMGLIGSNYLQQITQTTKQFSSTATWTGFHADRNGVGITMRAGLSNSISTISSTNTMTFNTNWTNGDGSGSGTLAMHIDGVTQRVGIGFAAATTTPASLLTVDGGDTEVTGLTSGYIGQSPDGTRWKATFTNSGAWTIAAA